MRHDSSIIRKGNLVNIQHNVIILEKKYHHTTKTKKHSFPKRGPIENSYMRLIMRIPPPGGAEQDYTLFSRPWWVTQSLLWLYRPWNWVQGSLIVALMVSWRISRCHFWSLYTERLSAPNLTYFLLFFRRLKWNGARGCLSQAQQTSEYLWQRAVIKEQRRNKWEKFWDLEAAGVSPSACVCVRLASRHMCELMTVQARLSARE